MKKLIFTVAIMMFANRLAAQNVAINSTGAAPDASAALDISSTTGALLVPRMTSTNRDALTAKEGMIIYNTTSKTFQGYANSSATMIDVTKSSSVPFSVLDNGYWTCYQSFTATSNASISSIKFSYQDNTDGAANGTLSILSGDGVSGGVLHTQSVVYPQCASGICEVTLTLTTSLAVTSGTMYTIKLDANSGEYISAIYSSADPYTDGRAYQEGTGGSNSGFLSSYDLWMTIDTGSESWVDLH
jgi:hypothetical protein